MIWTCNEFCCTIPLISYIHHGRTIFRPFRFHSLTPLLTRMHSSRMGTVRCIGRLSCHACPPPRQTPTPVADTHPPGQTPTPWQTRPDGHCSGQYASYWNASLLTRMHSSKMCTICCNGCLCCHTCSPRHTYLPCHTHTPDDSRLWKLLLQTVTMIFHLFPTESLTFLLHVKCW